MTRNKVVIDANIVLEWLDPQESTQRKNAFYLYELLKKGEIVIYAPVFLLVEVANILFWKKKMAVKDILTFIDRVKNSGVNFVVGSDAIEDIINLMDKYQITSYDAQYVYLAEKMNLKLATFDEKLGKIESTKYIFKI